MFFELSVMYKFKILMFVSYQQYIYVFFFFLTSFFSYTVVLFISANYVLENIKNGNIVKELKKVGNVARCGMDQKKFRNRKKKADLRSYKEK